MIQRWSAEPLAMLWPDRDWEIPAGSTDGGGPMLTRRPVMVIAAG
jgi:hypothetical protein